MKSIFRASVCGCGCDLCICIYYVALCAVYIPSAVDRLQIHFDDSHFVFRWISYKYVFFRYFSLLLLLLSSSFALLLLLLEINHFGFYAFSPWAFSGFPFWTEFRLYLFFSYTFFESLEAHFIREKKNKKIKKIRPRFIKWMTSHHLSVDVCFFPH